jgi:methyl-accepting chemotaxis protein
MVEEATAASVALNDEAQTLKALATRFNVSGSGNAAALASVAQKMRAPAAAAPSRVSAPAIRRTVAPSRGSAAVAQDSWEEF